MINTLREVWTQNFARKEGVVRWLQPNELRPSGERFNSPYDPEACYATRRKTEWVGYKAHLPETCEDDEPHLVRHVETRPSVVQDVSATEAIHQALADKGCLPEKHLLDGGYVDTTLLLSSQEEYGITLVGPPRENTSWQARANQGFSNTDFKIDWEKKTATCPMSKTSYPWKERKKRVWHGRYTHTVYSYSLDLKIASLVLRVLHAQKRRHLGEHCSCSRNSSKNHSTR